LRIRLVRLIWDLLMGACVGVLCGGASALFLALLSDVIALREMHPKLLFALPFLGLISTWLYHRFGKESEAGNRLVVDEVLEWKGRVPSRMAPLVLIGTLLTHLGGGSAGREGTAVQMGAALARSIGKLSGSRLGSWLRLTRSRQRLLLQAGIAGGFASVFGTPLAGAIFGVESIQRGRWRMEGLLICFVSSFVGHGLARLLGTKHAHYEIAAMPLSPWLLGKLLLFVLPIVIVAWVFRSSIHALLRWTASHLQWWLRPILGAACVIALALWLQDTAYLNLGLPWLDRIFRNGDAVPSYAFAAKLAITVLTLGFGFKGGEVTPLFVIGSLLGAALAPFLGVPSSYLAALGFAALFSTASHTPVASILMGVHLFGLPMIAPLICVCAPAYALMGMTKSEPQMKNRE
jgi:H+/Cl- antiporter ClcA